jgi:poly-beta-1,6-N-acetyl-D-glucosamine synthase
LGEEMLPVSVIICARNEEENLLNNLPLILEQDYPNYEVVVVNDCSQDDSQYVLRDFSQKYSHLKVVTINEHQRHKHGKKFAVTLGIKAASHEHLIFTDADCRPSSRKWIFRIQQNFSGNTDIVIAYSPYVKLDTFVNKLIRFETFFTALNYLSFALAGNPYMGVGRNMAYTKSLFFRAKGFASHMHVPSGDDDLFVNQNANSTNTRIEIHPESQVWTTPKLTFSSYLNQKIRHLGAGKLYKTGDKFSLSMHAGSAILFYILLFALLLIDLNWWPIVLGAYLLRLAIQSVVYYPIFKKLNYKDLFLFYPAFDLIYFFYILALNIITIFKKKVQWR